LTVEESSIRVDVGVKSGLEHEAGKHEAAFEDGDFPSLRSVGQRNSEKCSVEGTTVAEVKVDLSIAVSWVVGLMASFAVDKEK